MELINELTILLTSYFLFLFTEFMDDPDIQWNSGWIIIGLTVVDLLVNMLIIVIQMIIMLR
jgi:hypothetical protein